MPLQIQRRFDIKIPRFGYTPCCVAALPLRPLNRMITSSSVNRKMMKRLASFLMVTAAATMLCTVGVMTGCQKEKKVESREILQLAEEFTLDATAYDKFYYFSLESGKLVKVGEGDATKDLDDTVWMKRSDWDIAFHRFEVRLNGGASGSGNVEAADLGVVDFDGVKAIPTDAKFERDEKDYPIIIDFSAMQTGGKFRRNTSVNPILTSWSARVNGGIEYHGPLKKLAGMGQYELSNHVFVIRVRSGKLYKLQWTQYCKDETVGGERKVVNGHIKIR